MKTNIVKVAVVFVFSLASFVLSACGTDQFLAAVHSVLEAAEFRSFDNPSEDGAIYVTKSDRVTSLWYNPQNTRYTASLSGKDAHFAKAWQAEDDSGVVFIEIIGESDGNKPLDITLHLNPLKGEIKRPPEQLKLPLFFYVDDDSSDEGHEEPIVLVGFHRSYYNELQTAIDAAGVGSSGTPIHVKLLKDIELSGTVELQSKHIKLKGDKTIKRGGALTGELLTVGSGASLEMENVTLDGGAFWDDGTGSPASGASNTGRTAVTPLVRVSGTLTMKDNAVIMKNDNTSGSANTGGGVRVEADGMLVMDGVGAQIAYNRSNYTGGGVQLGGGSSFELKKGSINNNYDSENDGGGVYVGGDSVFTMAGGAIEKNSAAKRGGGVATGGGEFKMSGGSIEENHAGHHGGGVRVADGSSSFVMSGGEIKSNTAAQNGDGVYLENDTVSFTMSGSAVVNADNDVYLTSGKYITVSENLSGTGSVAKITLPYALDTQVLDGDKAEDNAHRFTVADASYYIYAASSSEGKIHNKKVASRTVGGAERIYPTLAMAIDKATGTLSSPDIITILENADLGNYNIGSGKHIKLTSPQNKGVTLTRKAENDNLSIESSASLTLEGGTGGTLTIDGVSIQAYEPLIKNSGTFTLRAGVILKKGKSNSGGGAVFNAGTFTMEGGKISDNESDSGGGVYNKGTFTMNGGEIKDNTARYGGGVFFQTGTFTMNGGEIKENTAQYDGGGVFVSIDTFNMSGGTIKDNGANYGGGVLNGGDFIMDGGTIRDNTAKYGGGVYNGGDFTMAGGTIIDNSATSSGKGVYHGGESFTMSGGSQVGGDVYLVNGKTIRVKGALGASQAAFITPSAYTAGRALLSGESADLTDNIGKFSLTPPTSSSTVGSAIGTYDIDPSDGKIAHVLVVANSSEWNHVLVVEIPRGGNYIVLVSGEVTGIPGTTTSSTFGGVTGLKVTLKIHNSAPGAIGSLSLASQGNLIQLGAGQTLIIDGPTLKGISYNTTHALIGLNGAVATTKLILLSGVIQGNTNRGDGGGVYVNGGTFEMKGGTIRNNNAQYGGGVYVYTDSVFSKTGGIVYGNSSKTHIPDADNNTAVYNDYSGHAAYYYGGGKFRKSTLSNGDNISTSSADGWFQ